MLKAIKRKSGKELCANLSSKDAKTALLKAVGRSIEDMNDSLEFQYVFKHKFIEAKAYAEEELDKIRSIIKPFLEDLNTG